MINKVWLFKAISIPICISLIILNGCGSDNPTESNNITISGTVELLGENDHSGVKIALYKPVSIDTALTNLNERYPGIGYPVSQQTEFDPKNNEPVYNTSSNSTGNWKIEATSGDYIIMASKEGFGWQIEYPPLGNNELILQKTQNLSGTINQSLILPNNTFVVIENIIELGGGILCRLVRG